MEKEERLKSKLLYKAEIYAVKTIPMIMAALYLLNTVLSYIGLDVPLLSYLGGSSLLTLAFLYVSSYAFKFCAYHRMFIHYVAVNDVINIYDYYIGIPVSDWQMFTGYIILTGIFVFTTVYLKFKKC